jgi:hypothetical protein
MKRIQKLAEKHSAGIEACGLDLALNMDTPANDIIRGHCSDMRISRMDYERIQAHLGGYEFVKPPARIMARW